MPIAVPLKSAWTAAQQDRRHVIFWLTGRFNDVMMKEEVWLFEVSLFDIWFLIPLKADMASPSSCTADSVDWAKDFLNYLGMICRSQNWLTFFNWSSFEEKKK